MLKKILALVLSLVLCVPAALGQIAPNIRPPVVYGAAYKSITLQSANVPDTIWAAGSNVNGAVIWECSFWSTPGANAVAAIIAKTSAPTSVIDGDVVIATTSPVTQPTIGRNLVPIYIAAGKGLYYISASAETNAMRACLYTLL